MHAGISRVAAGISRPRLECVSRLRRRQTGTFTRSDSRCMLTLRSACNFHTGTRRCVSGQRAIGLTKFARTCHVHIRTSRNLPTPPNNKHMQLTIMSLCMIVSCHSSNWHDSIQRDLTGAGTPMPNGLLEAGVDELEYTSILEMQSTRASMHARTQVSCGNEIAATCARVIESGYVFVRSSFVSLAVCVIP